MTSLIKDYIKLKCINCQRAGVKRHYDLYDEHIEEILFHSKVASTTPIQFCFTSMSAKPKNTVNGIFTEITNGRIYHCKLNNMYVRRLVQNDYSN